MPTRRRSRCLTALLALVSLLFMQLAVARYVCPGELAQLSTAQSSAQSRAPCTEPMNSTVDTTQPNLCKAHCEASQQSAQTAKLPLIALIEFPRVFPVESADPMRLVASPAQAPLLTRTTAPPLSVRHCCFRI